MSTYANAIDQAVTISAGNARLDGDLSLPPKATGLVVFAHGSGSSRRSPRNRHVAEILHYRRLGTLLFDLLTADEVDVDDATRRLRFDIDFLATRLIATTDWLSTQAIGAGLPIGYFGASTGAAAALVAAANRPAPCARSSRAVAGPTSRCRSSTVCKRRRCSLSAAQTARSSR